MNEQELMDKIYEACPNLKGDLDNFDGYFLTWGSFTEIMKTAWPGGNLPDVPEEGIELFNALIEERDQAANLATQVRTAILELRSLCLAPILEAIEQDPHHWTSRPCQTCAVISALADIDFGCVKKAKEKSNGNS